MPAHEQKSGQGIHYHRRHRRRRRHVMVSIREASRVHCARIFQNLMQ